MRSAIETVTRKCATINTISSPREFSRFEMVLTKLFQELGL
jgi:hypothetical protein